MCSNINSRICYNSNHRPISKYWAAISKSQGAAEPPGDTDTGRRLENANTFLHLHY